MSDATTGTAQAKARVSTIRSSPCRPRRNEELRPQELVGQRVLAEEAQHVDARVRQPVAREKETYGERVGTDDTQAGARSRVDVGPGTEKHGQPLARIVAADEDDVLLAIAGVGERGDQRAVRDHVVLPGQPARRGDARLLRDGDPVVDPVHQEAPDRSTGLYHLSSPEAWKVATTGHSAAASAATQIAGVIGSWRWRTSNRSCANARRIFLGTRAVSTMFGSEPFAGTITERPTGITSSGGLS